MKQKQNQHKEYIWLSKGNSEHPPPVNEPIPKGVNRKPLCVTLLEALVGQDQEWGMRATERPGQGQNVSSGPAYLGAGKDLAKMLCVLAIPPSITPCLGSRAHPSTEAPRLRGWIWRASCWTVAFPGNSFPVAFTATRYNWKHYETEVDGPFIGVTWAPREGWLRRQPLWKGCWLLLLWAVNPDFSPGEERGKFPMGGAGQGGCYCCDHLVLPLLLPQQLPQGMVGVSYWSRGALCSPIWPLEGRRDNPPYFISPAKMKWAVQGPPTCHSPS